MLTVTNLVEFAQNDAEAIQRLIDVVTALTSSRKRYPADRRAPKLSHRPSLQYLAPQTAEEEKAQYLQAIAVSKKADADDKATAGELNSRPRTPAGAPRAINPYVRDAKRIPRPHPSILDAGPVP